MKAVFCIFWQCTWGFLQTLLGFAVFLAHLGKKHTWYHGAVVTEWDNKGSVSLGLFMFVSGAEMSERLLIHEYGHAIQSLCLGPLYLPVIGLPSLLWSRLPACSKRRREKQISYYSFFTEKWADRWGERVVGKKAD